MITPPVRHYVAPGQRYPRTVNACISVIAAIDHLLDCEFDEDQRADMLQAIKDQAKRLNTLARQIEKDASK